MVKTVEKPNASGLAPVTVTIPKFTPAEPAAFRKKRQAAQAALKKLQPPSDKKYTNWLRREIAEQFDGKSLASLEPSFEIKQADYNTGLKTIAIPLAKAIKDWPQNVESYLLGDALPADAHWFSALSGALYSDGAAIVVPPNTKAEVTIELPVESGKLNAFRIVVVAGEGSEVSVFEKSRHSGRREATARNHQASATDSRLRGNDGKESGNDTTIVTTGTEVYAGPNSNVSYYALQEWPDTVTHLAAYRSYQSRDAHLDWLIGSFGSGFTQVWAELGLTEEGASGNVFGSYFGGGKNHLEQSLIANHVVGKTSSETYARGVVAENARAVYRGMIKIQQGAHGSSADQNGHAMLLGNDAHADAIPGLEIDADDVVAGHGATVGQVDDEQLFYLMARGISEASARKLIIRGFFEDLFRRINSETARIEFQRAVEARLG
ncbi:Fe-S cluster assembly protein SufD [Patescibacteria group bacterium]|nr:Fe-S cluster assembly protein SufD [Patescibacteria group bacterium]